MSGALRIRVRGQVQGVGFRPFVWQLAHRLNIRGEVLNDPEGVLIHAQGARIADFVAAITAEAPPLARVDAVETTPFTFDTPPTGFEIAASQGTGAETRVTPDAATCPDCLADIRGDDPRRRGYAFTNCTHCGPRFTILKGLPYDRARTTMAGFEMCPDCAAEYADPGDRRFHAQPVACALCGPHLGFEDANGAHPDAIAAAARALLDGAILAVKGLGGFHLCCDATNAQAIDRLRRRKYRPSKPLALMGRWQEIDRHARPDTEERAALASAAAPIVLLAKGDPLPEALAPSQNHLGWMLPYTPLHHLLLDAVARPLVMTSGNLSGEPQVIGNAEARDKLGGIADAILDHDRDIARRLDDSVMRLTPEGPMILRRARGMVPDTLPLPDGFGDAPQVVAYGGQMKGALCLIKNGQALLGHHLGELDEALSWDAFCQADRDYAELFDHTPEVIAVDLHPGYRPTQHGWARAEALGLPCEEVQHHHAHLASCLAENGWPLDGGKVAGIILDGTGLGSDGTVWGGELLLGDYQGFERRAWLKPAPLIGGDMASREPWRNALARLDQAGLSDWADQLFGDKPLEIARMAASKGLNAPQSSSAGRLFDAVAACLGVCADRQSYEGEAAMRLETMAAGYLQTHSPAHGFGFYDVSDEIDPYPMFMQMSRALAAGESVAHCAALFHIGLARVFARKIYGLYKNLEAEAVVLSGGCFQNALLLRLVLEQVDIGQLPVLTHRTTPANDGGLALGQAVIAAARHPVRR
ncbi:hydrogenase maturation protein HypF [Mameliella alba]|uniref:carbamoyltransferase HypF n=1 Tax=Mameliella alba TaxID=561184 RepID=UPI000880C604|nr:carbamoyltransferase HypF [Mameliella alba]PTR37369.1 hydrogenase maturation protein HypF [Mameliella alba]GGF74263.1 carbamoyltransferase HypF [Mameliella alba]SDD74189.1 hydrogenase maturation protein HypF [Mameliella alba]